VQRVYRREKHPERERQRARGTGSGENTHNCTPFTFEWKMSMLFSGNTGAEGKENEVSSEKKREFENEKEREGRDGEKKI
jgi:hypothetical protein